MKILVTLGEGMVRDTFFTPKVVKELEALGEVVWNETGNPNYTKEDLMANIKDIDIVFTGWGSPAIDADVLVHANKLKIHAHTASSVAIYTSKEEYDRGILVLSGNDAFSRSVAEGCLSYTLNALRCHEERIRVMREGNWKSEELYTNGLFGKKIGIVGFSTISRYYMELIAWFKPEIYIYSAYITPEQAAQYGGKVATLEEIFSECDIISLHSSLNDATTGMITRDLLKSIKPGALLVNTARAGLVGEQDLIEELATGRFTAALDVYHQEPLSNDSPLFTMPNVELYPHLAGPTVDMRAEATLHVIKNIKLHLAGKPCPAAVTYDRAILMTKH